MHRFLFVFLATLMVVPMQSAEEQQAEVIGQGTFPVSDSVSALWLNGPSPGSRPQPLIMVYYRGPANWHNRQWHLDSQIGKMPARARLVSDDLELIIEYGPGGRDVRVQKQPVDLSAANVFLVAPVAQANEKATITGLGLVPFNVPEGGNPALYILESNPNISKTVLQ